MSQRFVDFLVSWDIYGHQIGVNYHGKSTYQTRLGAFCSFTTAVLIMINLVTLLVAFNDGSSHKHEFRRQTLFVDRFDSEEYYLNENHVNFAISIYPPIPQNIGTISVQQFDVKNETNNHQIQVDSCDSEQSSVI